METIRNYLESMHREFSDPANKWMVIACEKEFKDIEESDENEGALRIDEIDLTKDMDMPEPEVTDPEEPLEDEEDVDLDDLEFPDVLEDIDDEEGDL